MALLGPQTGVLMSCMVCGSDKLTKYTAEMNIHLTGLTNLNRPGVWVFPELLVCLNCGFSPFMVPTAELAQLANAAQGSQGNWTLASMVVKS
jgi:hypothetical protein